MSASAFNRSVPWHLPDRPVTDDEVIAAVAEHGTESRISFSSDTDGRTTGWVETGNIASALGCGWGRAHHACLGLVDAGRLVQGPHRSAYFRLSRREATARRRRVGG